ncbi:MAG TPA: hypothetical protein EYN79_00485 [Planctomycetes bacterium]|nr:hypothetical protein [Planctomycetota bacterium]
MKIRRRFSMVALVSILFLGSFTVQINGQESDPSSQRWPSDVVVTMGGIPVQDGGRVKPIDTIAGFKLLKLNGRRGCKTVDGDSIDAMEWLLDCLFRPEVAVDHRCFLVRNDEVLTDIGLDFEGSRKSDRYSYKQLLPGLQLLFKKAGQLFPPGIDANEASKTWTGVERQLVQLARDIQEFESLLHYLDFARFRFSLNGCQEMIDIFGESPGPGLTPLLRSTDQLRELIEKRQSAPPERAEQIQRALLALQQEFAQLDRISGAGLAIFPPEDSNSASEETDLQDEVWLRPMELLTVVFDGAPAEISISALENLESIASSAVDDPDLAARSTSLVSNLRNLAEARGEYGKIPLEILFYRIDFFYHGLILFILSFIFTSISWLAPRTSWIQWATWASLLGGLTLVIGGIVLRCIIRSRPPVSTLYETILFITACAVLTGLFIEWLNRKRIALATASILGLLGCFLSMKYEFKEAVTTGDTMPSLVAVLDTNFWLATHVTCVTLGYSAGLLAAALAHIWIFGKIFGFRRDDKDFYRTVSRMVYGVICFGLLFSVVGTILGGIWANYSWGRFWGWDPKENGALMICLAELAILHFRLCGYIREHGLALLAIFNGVIVAFSWWGVNLLGVTATASPTE